MTFWVVLVLIWLKCICKIMLEHDHSSNAPCWHATSCVLYNNFITASISVAECTLCFILTKCHSDSGFASISTTLQSASFWTASMLPWHIVWVHLYVGQSLLSCTPICPPSSPACWVHQDHHPNHTSLDPVVLVRQCILVLSAYPSYRFLTIDSVSWNTMKVLDGPYCRIGILSGPLSLSPSRWNYCFLICHQNKA